MKDVISFTNLTKKRIDTADFKRIYKKLLPGWEVSVVFAGPALMKNLNKKYRNKNKMANVLSFLLEATQPRKTGLGEIFLNSNEKQLSCLFAHACLHLSGYSHKTQKNAKIMEQKEKEMVQ